MSKFKLLALAILAALPFTLAADGFRSIRVDLNDGSTLLIGLSENLTTKFTRKEIRFTDSPNVNIIVDKTKVKQFNFVETAGINDAEANDTTAPTVENGTLVFTGLPAGAKIAIYDLGGQLLRTVETDGETTLRLADFNPGVYIATVNGTSYKIILK